MTIDVGNTHTNFGVFEQEELLGSWRISTSTRRTEDEWGVLLGSLLAEKNIPLSQIERAIVSSVVPPALSSIELLFKSRWKIEYLVVRPGVKTGLSVKAEPKEVGADRIVNAVAAAYLYGGDLIIIDFGTATTFCAVSNNKEYLGGAIAPGIGISFEALYEKTAKLPRVDIEVPPSCIGRSTLEAMHSGIFFGYIGLGREIVGRMKEEFSLQAKVIATGGWGVFLHSFCDYIDLFNPVLTLEGLKIIDGLNQQR
ncbi:MAG: type pantothenate kinase [Candidatus Atribacteria bacterium]|nr:type pantothenate kinase [Candidatus Atribacteria bacterium]